MNRFSFVSVQVTILGLLSIVAVISSIYPNEILLVGIMRVAGRNSSGLLKIRLYCKFGIVGVACTNMNGRGLLLVCD